MMELLNNITNPEWIMMHGGLYLVLLIIFIETGIIIGFFLPGDPLLFVTGILLANIMPANMHPVLHLVYWLLLISVAGIIGNYVGYWFGKRSGKMLMQRDDSWIFKKKYLHQAKDFYERKGGSAIIIARFLPVVRTFAPIIAGMVGMRKRTFTLYNILGSFIWVGTIVSAGYLLGDNAWVKNNLETIILSIVLIAVMPVLLKFAFGKNSEPISVPNKSHQEKE